jgi:hypothetical protein
MRTERDLVALRRSVSWHEQEFRRALTSLGDSARESLEPTRWVKRRPLSFVVGAFAMGYWLAARRRHP